MFDVLTTANLFTDRDDVPETAAFNFSPIRVTSQVEDLFEMKFIYLYDNVPRPFFITSHIGIPAPRIPRLQRPSRSSRRVSIAPFASS
jgi:hypothetical protein